MLQEYEDYFLEEDKIGGNKVDDVECQKDPEPQQKQEEQGFLLDKAFPNVSELPEPELYFGGDKGETDAEHDLRMIRYSQREEMERLGMTVSSGSVVIKKDQSNMIGISIGGGAPFCPCLYIVQVFDGTPVAKDSTLQSGDELLGVNGVSVKGKTKVEVAKMIQSAENEVIIHYNKLHADHTQGESLDIALKKIKHRLVENMSSRTADALGLSRAILCNDSLVKRLQELEGTELMYRGLVDHCKRVLKAYFNVFQTMHAFGNEFCTMSVREPQPRASEAYRNFGDMHKNLEKDGIQMIKALKPIIANFGTYLNKAIPDTKLTVRKYADAKFAYLSYCLKVKEMDDEEQSFHSIQESLYRVETGNYEYRLILRCRQEARSKFAKLRNDVLEKIELLEAKHAQNLADNLKKFLEGLAKFSECSLNKFESTKSLFPIEVDLKSDAFEYKSNQNFSSDATEESEEVTEAEEAKEKMSKNEKSLMEDLTVQENPSNSDLLNLMSDHSSSASGSKNETISNGISNPSKPTNDFLTDLSSHFSILTSETPKTSQENQNSLIPGFDEINLCNNQEKKDEMTKNLLSELGLDEIDLAISSNKTESTTTNNSFFSLDDLLK